MVDKTEAKLALETVQLYRAVVYTVVLSQSVQRMDYSINVQQYNWSEHSVCTKSVCLGSVKAYSSVHTSTVHLYKLCTVVHISVYIYEVKARLCVCPVYMNCLCLLDGMFLEWCHKNEKWLGVKQNVTKYKFELENIWEKMLKFRF